MKKRSQVILEDVAQKHKLRVRDILGRDRFAYIVAARREAILRMVDIGMTHGNIAKAMCRERTTILEYASPKRAAYEARRHEARAASRVAA